MTQASEWLLAALMRSTVGMTLAAGSAFFIVKFFRLRDPRIEQRLWLLVLLQGVLFVPVTIALPILPAARMDEVRVQEKPQAGLIPSEAVPIEEESLTEKPLMKGEFSEVGLRSGERLESSSAGQGQRNELGPEEMRLNWEWRMSVSWSAILVLTWGAGIIVLLWVGVWRYRSWMRGVKATLVVEKEWLEEWERLLKSKGVRREISLVVVERAGPALMWGKGGYRVVVPASRWREMDAGVREAILTHELTHYLRGHLWMACVARGFVLLHWFNPVAWWVLGRMEQQAEFECDEAAAEMDATQLAEGLMKLGRGAKEPVLVHCVAGGSIHERVRRLLEERKPSARWKSYASVGIGLIAILAAEFPLKAIPATEPVSKEPVVVAVQSQTQTVEEKTEAEPTAVKVPEEELRPGPKLMYQLGSDLYRSSNYIHHLELTSDGKFSVASGPNLGDTLTVQVLDTLSGKLLRTMRRPEGDGGDLLVLTISTDDRFVLTGESGGWLTIWDLHTGELLQRFQACETDITEILFHPSGKQFVCIGWDRKLFLRDLVEPQKVVREFTATDSEVTGPIDFAPACCGGFSEDGESLYVVSQAFTLVGTDLAFWKWNVADGNLVRSGRLSKISEGKRVAGIEFDPQGAKVACLTQASDAISSAELLVFSLEEERSKESKPLRREVGRFTSVIPTLQGVRLVTNLRDGSEWKVFGLEEERVDAIYRDSKNRLSNLSRDSLRMSRDGKIAVNRTMSSGRLLFVFDLEQKKLLNPDECLTRDIFWTNSAWSNSSRYLVTNYWQGFLSLVEAETGRVKWKVASGSQDHESMSFTANDEFVVVDDYVRVDEFIGIHDRVRVPKGRERRVQLYRAETGELVHQLVVARHNPVTYPNQARQVVASDDGKFVAVSCGERTSETMTEPQMKVFNFETGEEVSVKSKQVIPDEKHGYGQPPRERWHQWIYDDFTFVPGTHKLMLADSEWGREGQNHPGEPVVLLFDADNPTEVKETILDTVNEGERELPLRRVQLPGMYFSRSGNRLVSVLHVSGFPKTINAFCSWQFDAGEYVGFRRGPDLDKFFAIDRVLNDEFFVTQPVSLHPDREYEMIQYRRMTDGSILREFELKRDVFAHLKVISPDGKRMTMPFGSGIMQMWDLATVAGK